MKKAIVLAMAALLAAFPADAAGKKGAKKASGNQAAKKVTWQDSVAKAATDPAVLKAEMAKLQSDKAAQVEFVAAVNAAIAALPESPQAKAGHFAAGASAAVASASKDNVQAVLAEIYATVPVEHLPAVGDSLVATAFGRNNNAAKPYTDAEVQKAAEDGMKAVSQRVSQPGVDNPSQRDALAIAMFVKASAGSPEGLGDALADKFVPEADRGVAKDTWLPAAAKNNYDAINGSAGVEEGAEPDMTRPVFGVDDTSNLGAAVLGDLIMGGETYQSPVFSVPVDNIFSGSEVTINDQGAYIIPQPPSAAGESEPQPPVPPPDYWERIRRQTP